MRIPSLPDLVFYPVFALLVAGLIYGSLLIRPPGGEPVYEEGRLVAEGPALANFFNGPGTRAVYIPDFPGGPVARLSADATLDTLGRQSAGTGLYLPREFEQASIGQSVRVSILIRSAEDDLADFRAGYFTIGYGDSGWRTLPVTNHFEERSFEFTISAEAEVNEREAVGIWADPDGMGRSVLVRQVIIEIIPSQ